MKARSGFALLLVLFLVSVFCALVVVIATARLGAVDAAVAVSRARLRQDAGALVALAQAEAQQLAGVDVAATRMEGGVAWVTRELSTGRADFPLAGERVVDGYLWKWRCEDISCGFDLAGPAAAARSATVWARSQVGRQALPNGGAGAVLGVEAARAWQALHPGAAPRPFGNTPAPHCAARPADAADADAGGGGADAAGECRGRWGLEGRPLPLPRLPPLPGSGPGRA